jgi:hypothetical protein
LLDEFFARFYHRWGCTFRHRIAKLLHLEPRQSLDLPLGAEARNEIAVDQLLISVPRGLANLHLTQEEQLAQSSELHPLPVGGEHILPYLAEPLVQQLLGRPLFHGLRLKRRLRCFNSPPPVLITEIGDPAASILSDDCHSVEPSAVDA